MNLAQVIEGPIVTEKAMRHSENNQVVLRVHSDATKSEIKSAVEKYFGVEATGIKIIQTPLKIRVRGRHGPQPKRKPRKKAIVCLKAGQSFDILKMGSAPKKKTTKKAPEKTPEKSVSSEA